MPSNEKRKFQKRLSMRTLRHGNWRQTFVDCGGMCLNCYNVISLELHEPWGENKTGWAMFQFRILLCHDCHNDVHDGLFHGERYIRVSLLAEDVNIEILMEGGYDNWIKNHGLMDRFAWLLCQ